MGWSQAGARIPSLSIGQIATLHYAGSPMPMDLRNT